LAIFQHLEIRMMHTSFRQMEIFMFGIQSPPPGIMLVRLLVHRGLKEFKDLKVTPETPDLRGHKAILDLKAIPETPDLRGLQAQTGYRVSQD
jgi:hypothetical protein